MPRYKLTLPSGKTVRITSDIPPTAEIVAGVEDQILRSEKKIALRDESRSNLAAIEDPAGWFTGAKENLKAVGGQAIQGAMTMPEGVLSLAGRTAEAANRWTGGDPEAESMFTKAAQGLKRFTESLPGAGAEDLAANFNRGIGQMAGALAGGAGARVAGATRATAASMAAGSMFGPEFQSAFDRAIARGDSRDLALFKGLGYGTISTGIENIAGAGRIFRKLFPTAEEGAKALTKLGVSKEVAKNFASGYGEEGSQRFFENLIVAPEQGLMTGVGEEALVGALVQGPVATIGIRGRTTDRGNVISLPAAMEGQLDSERLRQPTTGGNYSAVTIDGETVNVTLDPGESVADGLAKQGVNADEAMITGVGLTEAVPSTEEMSLVDAALITGIQPTRGVIQNAEEEVQGQEAQVAEQALGTAAPATATGPAIEAGEVQPPPLPPSQVPPQAEAQGAIPQTDASVAALESQPAISTATTREQESKAETISKVPQTTFDKTNGPFTVEWGTRSVGNRNEEFDDFDEAKAAFKKKAKRSDFATIYDNSGNEFIEEEQISPAPTARTVTRVQRGEPTGAGEAPATTKPTEISSKAVVAKEPEPTGGVPYYSQLGENDAKDPNRKRKRSVPNNYKLAYSVGWTKGKGWKPVPAAPAPAPQPAAPAAVATPPASPAPAAAPTQSEPAAAEPAAATALRDAAAALTKAAEAMTPKPAEQAKETTEQRVRRIVERDNAISEDLGKKTTTYEKKVSDLVEAGMSEAEAKKWLADLYSVSEQAQPAPAEGQAGVEQDDDLWMMTRGEVARKANIKAKLSPELPPAPSKEYYVLQAISDKANRKPYDPALLQGQNVTGLKNEGLVSGKTQLKLTDKGWNRLNDLQRDKRDYDLAYGDLADKAIDVAVNSHKASVEKAVKEGKPVSDDVLSDYPDIRRNVVEQREMRDAGTGQGIAVGEVQAALGELGIQAGGAVTVVDNPDWQSKGAMEYDTKTGKPVRIVFNAAYIGNKGEVQNVLTHELAHWTNAEGVLDNLYGFLTRSEQDAIEREVTRLGYTTEQSTRETLDRGVEQLVKAWRGRTWFGRLVAKLRAWLRSKGWAALGRREAELIAARAVTMAQTEAGRQMSQQERAQSMQASQTTLREMLNKPVKGAKYEDRLRLKRSKAQLLNDARQNESWRDWYQRHEQVISELFEEDAGVFQRILSATSQAASVKANVGLALKAYAQMKRGQPFEGYLPAVRNNLERIRSQEKLSGPKIQAYEAANTSDKESVVVDRHIVASLFRTPRVSPTQQQREKAVSIINELASELGWSASEVQAALWAASIVRSGKVPQSYADYIRKLEANGTLSERLSGIGRFSDTSEGGIGLERDVAGGGTTPIGVGVREMRAEPAGAGMEGERSTVQGVENVGQLLDPVHYERNLAQEMIQDHFGLVGDWDAVTALNDRLQDDTERLKVVAEARKVIEGPANVHDNDTVLMLVGSTMLSNARVLVLQDQSRFPTLERMQRDYSQAMGATLAGQRLSAGQGTPEGREATNALTLIHGWKTAKAREAFGLEGSEFDEEWKKLSDEMNRLHITPQELADKFAKQKVGEGTIADWFKKKQNKTRQAKQQAEETAQDEKDEVSWQDKTAKQITDKFEKSYTEVLMPKERNAVREIVKDEVRSTTWPSLDEEGGPRNVEAYLAQVSQRLQDAGVSAKLADALAMNIHRHRQARWASNRKRTEDRRLARATNSVEDIVSYIARELIKQPPQAQNAEWRQKIAKQWFENAGLDADRAAEAAKLFDALFAGLEIRARQKAAEKILTPLKRRTRKKIDEFQSMMNKLRDQVRIGMYDPSHDWQVEFAKEKGWSPMTKKESDDLSDWLEEIETALPHRAAVLRSDITKMIQRHSKPSRGDEIASIYSSNQLSGMTTQALSLVAPISETLTRVGIDIAQGVLTGNLNRVHLSIGSLVNSFKLWGKEFRHSFKHDAYTEQILTQIEKVSNLYALADRGLKAFQNKSLPAHKRAAGFVKWLVSLVDIVRKTMASMDQAWQSTIKTWQQSVVAFDQLREAGYDPKDAAEDIFKQYDQQARYYDEAIAAGKGKLEASVEARDRVQMDLYRMLAEKVDKTTDTGDSQAVYDNRMAAVNEGQLVVGNHPGEGIIGTTLHRILSGIQRSVSNVPILYRMIAGFPKVNLNIVLRSTQFTPLGFVQYALNKKQISEGVPLEKRWYKQSMGTAAQQRQRLREATVGTIATAIVAALWYNDKDKPDEEKLFWFDWVGPTDAKKRAAWLRQGHKPFSLGIKAGDRRVNVNITRGGLEPLQAILGTVGIIEDAKRNGFETLPVLEVAQEMFAMTGMPGAETESYTGEKSLRRNVMTKASGFIPMASLLRTFNKIAGPQSAESFPRLPLAYLPMAPLFIDKPALNFMGEPVHGVPGYIMQKLGLPITTDKPDRVYVDMDRLGVWPQQIMRDTVEKRMRRPITEDEWYRFMEIYGKHLGSKIRESHASWRNSKPEAIAKRFAAYKDTATAAAFRDIRR